jgi:DNA-binding NarL/FixJ family response regulator
MPKAPISVLIVDDQRLQRDGFRMLIDSQKDLTVVGDVGDGAQALAFVRRTLVDVVLMDIRMPRVNGFVATERIRSDAKVRELGPVPRVVLLTALDLDDYLPIAASAGAWAMLYKDVPPAALLEAIRGAAKAASDDA